MSGEEDKQRGREMENRKRRVEKGCLNAGVGWIGLGLHIVGMSKGGDWKERIGAVRIGGMSKDSKRGGRREWVGVTYGMDAGTRGIKSRHKGRTHHKMLEGVSQNLCPP